jgi:hypothetical protein
MNVISRIAAYEPVSLAAWSYTMTPDDFPDGCSIRTDALSGRQWAFGRNKIGLMVSAPLNVPLCKGCDLPITDGICPDCELVFVGEPLVSKKRAA